MRIGRVIAIVALAGAAAGAACSQSGPIRLADDANASVRSEAALVSEACAADQYQILVGQIAGEVDTTTLPQPVTLVGYGAQPTGAAQPGRMLLQTGADGRISEVRCDTVS